MPVRLVIEIHRLRLVIAATFVVLLAVAAAWRSAGLPMLPDTASVAHIGVVTPRDENGRVAMS